MANDRRITIRMRGRIEDGGDVRFEDFIRQLDSVRTALSETERITTATKSVAFRVIGLSHNSPATIVLEAVDGSGNAGVAADVVGMFMQSIDAVRKGTAPDRFDYPAFRAFKEISKLVDTHKIEHVGISHNGDTEIPVSALAKSFDLAFGSDERETGSVSGMLEQINLHANQNVFTIYRASNMPKLRCVFAKDLRQEAIGAVGKHVTVFGQLKYKARLDGGRPFEMKVTSIEVHPPDDELPTLMSLFGIAPDLTGNQSSEDYVRRLRDEW